MTTDRSELPKQASVEKCEHEKETCDEVAAQAANKLRQCAVREDKDSGGDFQSTEKVFEKGKLLATRTTAEGPDDLQYVEIKLGGKTYVEDTIPIRAGEDPTVVRKLPNGKFQDVKSGSPEYEKVVNSVGHIYFEDLPDCKSSSSKINVASESNKIARLLEWGEDSPRISEAAQRLSGDLKKLSGNMKDYNLLLKGISYKISDEPAANPSLGMDDFNAKTGTWDKVTINTYTEDGIHKPLLRVVQPGNTLGQIALDSKSSVKDLQEMNKEIVDPGRIFVGQMIRVRNDS
jgi:hypothetical protein